LARGKLEGPRQPPALADVGRRRVYIGVRSKEDDVELIQIILFGSVALFLAIRLYSVLGRRTGHEPKPDEPPSRTNRAALEDEAEDRPRIRPAFTGPAAAGMEAIRSADGVFDPDTFLPGATEAYRRIVEAFAEGERGVLQLLLSPEVMRRYGDAIDAREAAGRTQTARVAEVRLAEIENAWLMGDKAQVEVRFDAEIAKATRDAEGEVVEGDPDQLRRVTELWTFERRIDADDPNWLLVKVRTV
jgi:predicted lipid-binding transport protein (Tim44 family)